MPLLPHLSASIDDLAIADVHEVIVPLAGSLVVHLAPHILLLLQHLTQVLDDELPLLQVLRRVQPEALCTRTPLQCA